MTKFYVQSGSFRQVIEAETDRKAAISAVQQAIQQVLPIDESFTKPSKDRSSEDRPNTYAVLASKMVVSELGFDSNEALELPTREVVTAWNQLISTLDRLERMLDSAV